MRLQRPRRRSSRDLRGDAGDGVLDGLEEHLEGRGDGMSTLLSTTKHGTSTERALHALLLLLLLLLLFWRGRGAAKYDEGSGSRQAAAAHLDNEPDKAHDDKPNANGLQNLEVLCAASHKLLCPIAADNARRRANSGTEQSVTKIQWGAPSAGGASALVIQRLESCT